jgi:hypothetical protein
MIFADSSDDDDNITNEGMVSTYDWYVQNCYFMLILICNQQFALHGIPW